MTYTLGCQPSKIKTNVIIWLPDIKPWGPDTQELSQERCYSEFLEQVVQFVD